MNREVDEIFSYLLNDSLSIEERIVAIHALGDIIDARIVSFLNNILYNDENWGIICAAAISLAKHQANNIVPFLMKLIMNPDNAEKNGALLYAIKIGKLECSDYFLDFINLICYGDWEAKELSLELIKRIHQDIKDDVIRKGLREIISYKITLELQRASTDTLKYVEAIQELLEDWNN